MNIRRDGEVQYTAPLVSFSRLKLPLIRDSKRQPYFSDRPRKDRLMTTYFHP